MYDVVCVLSQESLESKILGNDALSAFSRITHHACLSDRFGFLNQFSPFVFNSVENMPTFDCKHTLENLLLTRAADIYSIANAEAKTINVMWSGGVDSTAVVLAFIVSEVPVNVVYTASSIDEYPEFYEFIKTVPFVKMHQVTATTLAPVCASLAVNDLVVTGFPADQLFGSIVNQALAIPFDADWRCLITNDEAISQIEAATEFYKLPIKTISELTWFINFSCKWNIVTHALSSFYGLDCGNTINYFEPVEFQQWSLSNFDVLHKFSQVDPKYYKQELKNFIVKYFPKGSYLTTKGKTGSLGYACRYENDFVDTLVPWISWLDSNGVVHRQQHVETTFLKARYVQNYMLYKFLNNQRRV